MKFKLGSPSLPDRDREPHPLRRHFISEEALFDQFYFDLARCGCILLSSRPPQAPQASSLLFGYVSFHFQSFVLLRSCSLCYFHLLSFKTLNRTHRLLQPCASFNSSSPRSSWPPEQAPQRPPCHSLTRTKYRSPQSLRTKSRLP